MKLKYNVIITIITISFLLASFALNAQGVYGSGEKKANTTTNESTGGGIYSRDIGEGGTDFPPAPGEDEPIGEGIFILSILSGGYALLKRKVKNRNE